jgi:hypothetical protein
MSAKWIMFNSPDILYVITDLDGAILKQNDFFKEYASHIRPKNFSEIVGHEPDNDDLVAAVEKAKLNRGERVRCYLTTKQKNLALKFNDWGIYCMASHLHFVGIPMIDVTSVTAHEYEKQKKLLEDLRFDISHDFRQPVASSKALTKLILESDDTDKDSDRELLRMLEESIEKTDQAIHMLAKKAGRQL